MTAARVEKQAAVASEAIGEAAALRQSQEDEVAIATITDRLRADPRKIKICFEMSATDAFLPLSNREVPVDDKEFFDDYSQIRKIPQETSGPVGACGPAVF